MNIDTQKLAEIFCYTKLPDGVCSDRCASMPEVAGRTGTNLLSVAEAKRMFDAIFKDYQATQAPAPKAAEDLPEYTPDIGRAMYEQVKSGRWKILPCGASRGMMSALLPELRGEHLHTYWQEIYKVEEVIGKNYQAFWDAAPLMPELYQFQTPTPPSNAGLDEIEILKNEIRRLKRLFHLAEECSEVIKIASKSARFGDAYHNPVTGNTNKQELRQECADLVEVMGNNNIVMDNEFADMMIDKKAKVRKWVKIEEESLNSLVQAALRNTETKG